MGYDHSMRAALMLALALAGAASAAPAVTLRLATTTPDGSALARSLRQFDRELDELSGGEVRSQWVFGGAGGDELKALTRVGKGELEGELGAAACEQVAPSLRLLRTVGLFQS